MRAPSPWEPEQVQGHGGNVDPAAAVTPVRPPKHRPPPLDLSAVSNLPGTERRRR
jgi:hypothetical protein